MSLGGWGGVPGLRGVYVNSLARRIVRMAIAYMKTEDSGPDARNHSPSSVCSYFVHVCKFGLLLLLLLLLLIMSPWK